MGFALLWCGEGEQLGQSKLGRNRLEDAVPILAELGAPPPHLPTGSNAGWGDAAAPAPPPRYSCPLAGHRQAASGLGLTGVSQQGGWLPLHKAGELACPGPGRRGEGLAAGQRAVGSPSPWQVAHRVLSTREPCRSRDAWARLQLWLGGCQVLVEVEAKEAGDHLANGHPPDQEGEESAVEKRGKDGT